MARPGSCARASKGAVMTRILVLYGTTDGHTRQVAYAISDTLALVVSTSTSSRPARSTRSSGTTRARSSLRRFTPAATRRPSSTGFARTPPSSEAQPTAFVSVCLAVLAKANPKTTADLDAIVARFLATTGWRPTVIKDVAGALLYTRYDIFKRWMMKRIVARRAGPPTHRRTTTTPTGRICARSQTSSAAASARRHDDDGRPDAAAGHRAFLLSRSRTRRRRAARRGSGCRPA